MSKKIKDEFEVLAKPQVHNTEDPVRFSISKSFGTRHCISDLDRADLEAVCISFGLYEAYKWRDFKSLNGVGYTPDKSNRDIEKSFPQFTRFAHFRIKGGNTGLFRVFGTELNNMFYVLWFDKSGEEQH